MTTAALTRVRKLCLALPQTTCEKLNLWLQTSENTAEHGTAFTVSVDAARGRLGVAFEESQAEYDVADLDELGLGYAISIHKSQGSQYPAVIIPIHQTHYLMLRRNLLYTAVTRAERVCILVGTRSALAQAVRNEDERRRFSRLADRLRQ